MPSTGHEAVPLTTVQAARAVKALVASLMKMAVTSGRAREVGHVRRNQIGRADDGGAQRERYRDGDDQLKRLPPPDAPKKMTAGEIWRPRRHGPEEKRAR